MSRPPLTPVEEKVTTVVAVLRGGLSIKEAAQREGVTEASIEAWRDKFIDGGRSRLAEVGSLPIIRDVTSQTALEEELRQARLAAEQASQAKSEYLSRMSHELRTPLNAILGFAQLLELDDLGEEQRENLHYVLSAGRHLLALINEVLDIAAIEAGRLVLSVEPLTLADVINESVNLIRPLADQHGILLLGPTPSCTTHVMGDRQRLKQIVLNLLSNAIKYNRVGGTVQVACERVATGRVRINITDTGRGIAPDDVERLFVPFLRLGTEQHGIEGSGLGLPLSKRLAEAMGGSLDLTSSPEQGSTFWVELAMVETPVQRDKRPRHGHASRAREQTQELGYPLTVLYIEDNPSDLQLVERVISRRMGISLMSAMRPELGLDLAVQHQPDVILLDLSLPDMSGQEVLRRLRGNRQSAKIPVVIVSADARPDLIMHMLEQGVRGFLTKPLDVKELFELLEGLADERQGAVSKSSSP